MIFKCYDEQYEYVFDFFEKGHVRVERIANGLLTHKDYLYINNNRINWQSYHLREDEPMISPVARKIADRVAKNLAFM